MMSCEPKLRRPRLLFSHGSDWLLDSTVAEEVEAKDTIVCELCSFVCTTRFEWNAHILQHFATEICGSCNESLIRIGNQLYVLHTTLTCTKMKDELSNAGTQITTTSSPFRIEIAVDHSQKFLYKEGEEEEEEEEDDGDCLVPGNLYDFQNCGDDEEKVDDVETGQDDDVTLEDEIKRKMQARLSTKRYKDKLIKCDFQFCDEWFPRRIMHRHTAKIHGIVFRCDICNTVLASKAILWGHMRKSHLRRKKKPATNKTKTPAGSLAATAENDESSALMLSWKEKRKLINEKYYDRLVECSVEGCNVQVARKKIQSHLAKAHGVQYDCTICSAKLTTRESFQAHMQRHDPERERPECKRCKKTFADKNSLKNHEKLIHLKTAKKCICSVCGQAFKSNCFLKEHIYSHTGEKPFSCDIVKCAKTFRTKRLLSIHQRAVHIGKRPFECIQPDCGKAYAYDIDLKRHLFSAHSIWTKKHPCLICDKVFPENKLLRKHMDSHGVQS